MASIKHAVAAVGNPMAAALDGAPVDGCRKGLMGNTLRHVLIQFRALGEAGVAATPSPARAAPERFPGRPRGVVSARHGRARQGDQGVHRLVPRTRAGKDGRRGGDPSAQDVRVRDPRFERRDDGFGLQGRRHQQYARLSPTVPGRALQSTRILIRGEPRRSARVDHPLVRSTHIEGPCAGLANSTSDPTPGSRTSSLCHGLLSSHLQADFHRFLRAPLRHHVERALAIEHSNVFCLRSGHPPDHPDEVHVIGLPGLIQ